MHRRAGRTTYIVSASPQELVEPLAAAIGMTGGIGTRGEIVDGVYTGELVGPFCYGPGKVHAIREIAEWEGYDLNMSYAYSDSASDLPMLEASDTRSPSTPTAAGPDGPRPRLADRDLPPPHPAGRAPHHRRRRRRRGGRRRVRRRRQFARERVKAPAPARGRRRR